MKPTIVLSVISLLLSGVVAASISSWMHQQFNELAVKRDVLRRFVGHRYLLTSSFVGREGEPFVALNEIFVVYADHPEVLTSLRNMHDQLRVFGQLPKNILTLTTAMAKAAKVPIRELDQQLINKPFAPPSGPAKQRQ